MTIESLTKIPFIILFALGTHIIAKPPTPATPKEQRIMKNDKTFDIHWVGAIIRVSRAIATVDQDIS